MILDEKRFDRQLRVRQIGLAGQEKLARARVAVVGVGALGTYTAEQLVRGGVGELLLIDPDRIELSNLQRQSLFKLADVGKFKVEIARQALLEIQPKVEIKSFQTDFETAIFEGLGQIDLVLDCTDNFLVREAMNDFCEQEGLPFVFAAAAGTSGQVMAMQPSIGPCLNCVFPDLIDLEKNCETIGVMTPLIPLLSSMQVSLAYRILCDEVFDDWETMHIIDAWSLQFSDFKVKKRACRKLARFEPVCGGAFQAVYEGFTPQAFENYCQSKNWNFQQNKLAYRVKSSDITAFKNGRVLFYNQSEQAAKSISQELEHAFH